MTATQTTLPANGRSKDSVLAAMEAARARDADWRDGRVFSLVFKANDDVTGLLKDAYGMFFSENGLNPTAFPSLRRFETEVVAMVGNLLHGGGTTAGNMTTGGTESILMAMLTAREWARANRPKIARPEVVVPSSAHPAFDKAAHYFDMKLVRVPVGSDLRADVAAMRKAMNIDTVLLVGSAPSYPHGVVDPIADIAALSAERNVLCHVDACVGGMMLPFVRQLGYPVPDFDFAVPGVTSMSVDLHKYGYAAKGASVILYRDKALRRYQLYATTDWAGGIYASPTMTGTRPGGAIAAAWAIMTYLGERGYLEIAAEVMRTTVRLRDGINAIDGLRIVGNPPMSVMAIASDRDNVYEIGDEMSVRGWHLDRQQFPPTLHLTVNYAHTAVADAFLMDLAQSVIAARQPSLRRTGSEAAVKAARGAARFLPNRLVSGLTARSSALFGGEGGLPQRSAAMYGMMGTLPNRGDLHELVLDLLSSFTEM
ncbi:MAG: aspartate aminotransferase family protein [Caldilineae bacterium]|nr:aspartate aminotransferase family protein [Caldilineae bacterium]